MKKLFFILLFYLISSSSSYAYLDPGTGSIILQAIIAALAAATTVVTGFWKKIKTICSKVFSPKKKDKLE